MIEIVGVRQTAKEMRPVLGAWPVARTWGYVVRGWVALWLTLTMAVAWWRWGPNEAFWIVACLFALIYGTAVLALIMSRRLDHVARATPLGDAASRWTLDENGLLIVFPLGEQSLDWRAVVRVVEEKDRFLFAVTPVRTHVLPRRCLEAGQLPALRNLVEEVRASGRLGAGLA